MPRIACLLAALLPMIPATALAQLFTVSGTVRDPLAAPVPNVAIQLFDGAGIPIGIPPTTTNASGFYSVSGLPADTYGFGFGPPAATRLVARLVTPVSVSSNVTLDVTLDAGNLLSGTVRDTLGVAIAGIDLDVVDRSTNNEVYTPSDNTDLNGFYDVVIPDGEFDLLWRKLNPPPAYIAVEQREVITTDTVIDVTMVVGVFVSGTISVDGLPLQNANLDFIDSGGVKLNTPNDVTDLAGFYRVHVPIGTYDILVKADPNAAIVSRAFPHVSVTTGMTFDVALTTGVRLQGKVTDPSDAAVFDVDVDVHDSATGAAVFLPFDKTDASGQYQVAVPAGTWDLAFQPPVATMLAPVGLPNVALSVDTNVDVTVPVGVLLSGSVKNGLGVGVAGVDIDAHYSATRVEVPLTNDLTDAVGNYAVVVAPGTYDLDFEPAAALRLVPQRLPSVVINGASTLNVTLASGLLVRGWVTDQGGLPFPNVVVKVVTNPGGSLVFTPGNRSNASGFYDIVIPSGKYDLTYTPDPSSGVLDSVVVAGREILGDQFINVKIPVSLATGVGGTPLSPSVVVLHPNYPNPFNPTTSIRFEIAQAGMVQLAIYDARGARVRTLVSGPLPSGAHTVTWDGTDQGRSPVASGVYFYRLSAHGVHETRKAVLLK